MGQAADEVNQYTGQDDYTDDDTALDSAASNAGDDQDQSVDEPEQIRAQIEDTRAEMSSTIDAIQEKLNPDNLKEQAKEVVREATVGRVEDAVTNAGQTAKGFGADMLETIKQNPLPAALAGIGIGWLLMKRNENASRRPVGYGAYGNYNNNYSNDYGYNRAAPSLGYRPYEQQYYGSQQQYGSQQNGSQSGRGGVGDAAQQARDKLGDVADNAGDKVGQIGDKVGDTVGQVGDKVGQVGGQVGDKVGDLGEQAQYRAERAGDWFGNTLQENPLAIGAVAIAVGAAVGLLLPETPKEHQLMGEARDNLMNQAQDAVQNTVQKVQRVADQAQTAVKQEAQNQGLVGDTNNTQAQM